MGGFKKNVNDSEHKGINERPRVLEEKCKNDDYTKEFQEKYMFHYYIVEADSDSVSIDPFATQQVAASTILNYLRNSFNL
ncbi:hypothetical protein RhiirA4_468190 [Rhizophagus irregularis]|uniref:Uncharacterized protein n=1 Tax=Rhizophagus irregularis TaxID=588596 RepID=A0A2I1GXB5_9GLOM|nr:hypothetical protein RhiirA4_468190 [Rhizophagus irregularis]